MEEEHRRRRFRSEFLSGRNPEDRIAAIKGLLTLARAGYVEFVEDLITLSRRRYKDPANSYRLQVWMLQTLLPLQELLRVLKRSSGRTGEGAGSAPATSPEVQRDIHHLLTTIRAIRGVGDGLVWRLLGNDRATYRLLALGSSQGHIEETGLGPELAALAGQVGTESGTPLLSSLTNVVGFGDLLVFTETVEDNLEVSLVEVKTSKGRSPRVKRQRSTLKGVVQVLDERGGTMKDQEFEIRANPTRQEFHLQVVLNLIQHTAKVAAAGRTFEDYLRVECHDLQAMPNDQVRRVRDESEQIVNRWESRGDIVLELSNWHATSVSPNVAPYAVFPFPDRICALLLTNQILLNSFLNISGLLRQFEQDGWRIEATPSDTVGEAIESGNDPRDSHLARISRGPCTLELPSNWGARVALEFLKPKSLVRDANAFFAAGVQGSGRALFYYPDEARCWR